MPRKKAKPPSPFDEIKSRPDLVPDAFGKIMCYGCKQVLPIAAFGDRRDGMCANCAETQSLKVSRAKAEEKAAEFMDLLVIESRTGGINKLPKTEELVAQIVSSFGSMPLFVNYWKVGLDAVVEKKGWSVGVLNHIGGIFKLIAIANQNKHQEDVDKMSLEQIEREQKLAAIQLLKDSIGQDMFEQVLRDAGLLKKDAMLPPPGDTIIDQIDAVDFPIREAKKRD
ncbi:hypothetical protein [Planctomicrobium piriforme]|uniref:Uncharacterized protein n=1 Tax=Planctomicrobium piriforme TaxID=1576369 RepID=A0A1I3ED42_9PLAN|nr:hypothetical protein [Planctomicrobium piriforme]SFH96897.1 hypothetical protein SAMN05421753_104172 [Planctomicrobium piriforme]